MHRQVSRERQSAARNWLRLGLCMACVWAALASAQPATEAGAHTVTSEAPQIPGRIEVDVVGSSHRGVFNGRQVAYRAEVERHTFVEDDGVAQATLITTSYLRTGVDSRQRPVLFLFNGGPGASTTPLHFDAFGPWKRMGPNGAQYLVANPDSPLDTADLVFIDPVGTGYSRALVNDHAFWSVDGDARSVGQVIDNWLARHGRTASPRYLLGQSYGTVRALQILAQMPKLRIDGVALFALVGERGQPIFDAMTALPTYATAAHAHGRGDFTALPVRELYAQALEFARTDYLRAMVEGGSLVPDARARIARRVSALTGLSQATVLAADLKPTHRDVLFGLLADDGKRIGQLDVRGTRALDAPAARPPYDDPGLGYSVEASDAPPAPADAIRDVEGGSLVDSYYRQVLGFDAADTYVALNLEVNTAFQKRGLRVAEASQAGLRALARKMDDDPALRVFWAAGLYDLSTPAYSGRFALDQAGIPADRLTAAYFESGHSVFMEQRNRTALAGQLRAFVSPDPQSQDMP